MTSPILITGAGQRIGLALAKHFLSQGQAIIITYRTRHDAVDDLEQQGAVCIHADFSSDAGIASFIETLKQQLCKGRLTTGAWKQQYSQGFERKTSNFTKQIEGSVLADTQRSTTI